MTIQTFGLLMFLLILFFVGIVWTKGFFKHERILGYIVSIVSWANMTAIVFTIIKFC